MLIVYVPCVDDQTVMYASYTKCVMFVES